MPTPYITTTEELRHAEALSRYRGLQQAEVAAVGTPAFERIKELTDRAWQEVDNAYLIAYPGNTTTEKRLLAGRL